MTKTQTRKASGSSTAGGYHHRTGGGSQQRSVITSLTALAGTLMVLGGLWGVVVGIDALSGHHVEVTAPGSGYAFGDSVHAWGWVMLVLGIVIGAAGVCVFLGMFWARYVGAMLATISAIAGLLFIPYAPLWSIIMITLDLLVIWALLMPRRRPGEL
jgi:hypothetical protein